MLTDAVTKVFEDEGIMPSDNKGFKPHITLLKLSKAWNLRKKGTNCKQINYWFT